MATSREYIDFVLEQLDGVGDISARKMFGEYMVYLNAKPILSVCDNTVFVKILPEIETLMKNADCGFPYEGAKPHYILDIEDKELVTALISMSEEAIPLPKPKKEKVI